MKQTLLTSLHAAFQNLAAAPATCALRIAASLAVGLSLGACDSTDDDASPTQTAAEAKLSRRIDSVFVASMQGGTAPGMSVVVVKNGKTFFQKGYGYADVQAQTPVTNDTRFAIGSTTKAMTALAVLGLVDQGRVKLNEKVTTYLPDFVMRDARYQDIRVGQLLSHSSGIKTFLSDEELNNSPRQLEGILQVLAREELAFAPGQGFYYSNYGSTLAGLLVQRVTGTPYAAYMRRVLFDKVGMANTLMEYWQPNALGGTKGYVLNAQNQLVESAGGLHPMYLPAGSGTISTSNDVARYLTALVGGTTTRGEKLLSDSLTTRMFTGSVNANSDDFLQFINATGTYGFGWYNINRSGYVTIEHAGSTGAMLSSFVVDPRTQSAVAVLVNQQDITKLAAAADVARLVFSAE